MGLIEKAFLKSQSVNRDLEEQNGLLQGVADNQSRLIGTLEDENETLRVQLRDANRRYGRASETIGQQRAQIKALRSDLRYARDAHDTLLDLL